MARRDDRKRSVEMHEFSHMRTPDSTCFRGRAGEREGSRAGEAWVEGGKSAARECLAAFRGGTARVGDRQRLGRNVSHAGEEGEEEENREEAPDHDIIKRRAINSKMG